MVAGEASGDLLARLAAPEPARALAALVAEGIGGPTHGGAGLSTPGGRTTSWRCAATSRCSAISARSSAIRTQLLERLLRRQARCLHRRRRARLQPRRRDQAQGRRREDDPLRQPVDLGLARQADREDRPRRPTSCSASSRSSRRSTPSARSTPVYVGHPLASAIPFEVPRAASRAALGIADDATRRRAAARKPALRDPVHRAAPLRSGGADEPRPPGLRFVVPVVPGCATRSNPCASSTRPTRRSRCSTARRTKRSPPATSPSSPAARRRSRRRSSSGRWSSSTSCTR